MKLRITSISFALLISCITLSAQSPTAPIPAQLSTSRTVFVANAGSTPSYPQGATLVYNSVYQALAQAQLYKLTTTPADADLVLETSYVARYLGELRIPLYDLVYTQLVVRDAKTHSLLWTISEPIKSAVKTKTFENNISDSGAKLVADLAALINNNTPSAGSATSTKAHPNEGNK